MNQEKISKFIKEIRLKNNLTQEQFANIYNVTYQAVSKWENGKNLPDISILKKICNDYNKDINDLLDNNIKKNKLLIIIFFIAIFIIICLTIIVILKNNTNTFEFKPLKTTCNDFNLYGTIAYNKNKTSIHISNISYCGEKNTTKYKEIDCTLYEDKDTSKNKISTYKLNNVTLEEFLKKVEFNIEHYSKTCSMYKENGMHLEIEAKDSSGEISIYKIPLELSDC